jgi:hypothetical protein
MNFKEEEFVFERETWDRSLEYISSECVHYKNHLAALVRHYHDNDSIEFSEKYISKLLQVENMVKSLRSDISFYDQYSVSFQSNDGRLSIIRQSIAMNFLSLQRYFNTIRTELFTQLSQRA